MGQRFQNQVIVVTGATRGIGKEIARAFAQEGATVAVIGRNTQLAEEVAAEIRKEGHRAEGFSCDVTNAKNVEEIVNKILDKHKTIDILVNNAGMTKDNLLLRMSEADWDSVMTTNLKGVFNCTKAVSKVMLKARKG